MPDVYDSPNGANSPSHQPQQPTLQPQDGSDSRQQQQHGSQNQQQQSAGQQGQRPSQQGQQQAHSEPLPVPGQSRVDSAPDAEDDDLDAERP